MRSFLEDSDDPSFTHSKSKQTQLAHVRNLVYDAEDIVDEFLHHRTKWSTLRTTLCFPLFFWERRQIAIKLREINSLIKSIPERSRRYQLDHQIVQIGAESFKSESALFLKEEDLVGIEGSRILISRWITASPPPRRRRRRTISVVGMGGSGKTTLAANVFNSPSVKRCFDCVAWITVSQSFAIEDLLRSLIKEFNKSALGFPIQKIDELSRMSYRELVENLVDYLENRSYLVVLDDVWNVNVWSEIKVLLPDGENNCRVMITTRMEDIALYCSSDEGSHVYHVKPLENDEAWELFCSRAFPNKKLKSCPPPQLLDLAAEIVEKCQGLPLAIVSLGGLLSTKGCSVAEWLTVRGNLRWELSHNQMLQPIRSILLLSYYDLSYRLRCCFLYCCLFPEDSKIWCGRLIRLWIAEGFVEEGATSPEEVARRYLMELIGRNMLQFVDSELATHDRMCKMHDMYREVGLTIATQDKFFLVCDVGKSAALPSKDDHRLSVHQVSSGNQGETIKLIEGMSRIRSLFIVPRDGRYGFSLRDLDCRQFKYLRVLDLEEAPVEELPDNIDVLFNLRFLNLFATRVKRLPNSIGKLQNLQTLDLISTKVETLPKDVMELRKLRHLFTGHSKRSRFKPDGIKLAPGSDISKLKNLQSLRLVEANGHLVKQLRLMTQLVVLGITNVKGRSQMDELCSSLKNMSLLQRLTIATGNENEILHLEALGRSPPLPRLQYLTLFGKLEKFPRWVCSLPSLIDLQMHWSFLPVDDNPLKHLYRLPSLSSVFLNNACQGTELVFPIGFQNLKTMALKGFGKLESIAIAEGAMPVLKILQVSSCMNLKSVPQGIHHLTELEQLRLEAVPVRLVERIRGADRCYVRHIPLVQCRYYSSTGKCIQENLF
ncbi:Disease resistance protein RPM1 [Linum perenne]